jgi:hypothetical protein
MRWRRLCISRFSALCASSLSGIARISEKSISFSDECDRDRRRLPAARSRERLQIFKNCLIWKHTKRATLSVDWPGYANAIVADVLSPDYDCDCDADRVEPFYCRSVQIRVFVFTSSFQESYWHAKVL